MSGQGVWDGSGWSAFAAPERYRPGDRPAIATPPLPEGLCGAPDAHGHGCVFKADHVDNQPLHTWERW